MAVKTVKQIASLNHRENCRDEIGDGVIEEGFFYCGGRQKVSLFIDGIKKNENDTEDQCGLYNTKYGQPYPFSIW